LFSLVGKRLSTIAVSTNVPIHANNHTWSENMLLL
jgi:hypothetical protein